MGRIASPHGVRGWVKVVPWSENPETLIGHKAWWLRKSDDAPWREIEVVSARMHNAVLVAEFRGVVSREDAATLRGAEVAVPQTALEAPAANEYYWFDLEGMDVVNRSGAVLGRVIGMMESGAHPLLRVADQGGDELLIPFVAAYISRVDAVARRIEVDWEADY